MDPLKYCASPAVITDPAEHRVLLDGLPADIPALCQTVQGLILHIHWAERYGVQVSEKLKQEANLRKVSRQLGKISEVDARPLTTARSRENRLGSTCRDFAVFLCAVLRHQGVPARARCGFGTYFTPGKCEDHWICEYWKPDENRWATVDAQLDEFQRDALSIEFDTFDLPQGQFLPAGKAWQLCRAGQADPEAFGIFDCHGMWFIQGNLIRDLLSLNKMELLPWDGWGLMAESEQQDISGADMKLLDRIGSLTLAGNEAFAEVRAICENEERLRPPPDWEP